MVSSTRAKSKASGIFTVGGAIIGLAVTYFGTQGSLVWILIGAIAGGVGGYLIGRKVDSDKQ